MKTFIQRRDGTCLPISSATSLDLGWRFDLSNDSLLFLKEGDLSSYKNHDEISLQFEVATEAIRVNFNDEHVYLFGEEATAFTTELVIGRWEWERPTTNQVKILVSKVGAHRGVTWFFSTQGNLDPVH